MTIYLIGRPKSKSAALIANRVGISLITSPDQAQSIGDDDIIVRWGATMLVSKMPLEVQPPDSIHLAANKGVALDVMERAGVSVPRRVSEPPCIGRSERHQQGRGFYICLSRSAMEWARRQGASHFLEMLAIESEYRIHFWRVGGIMLSNGVKIVDRQVEPKFLVQKKIPDRVGNKPLDYTIRNLKNGWVFYLANDDKVVSQMKMKNQVIQAASALGLDFGAADIAVCEDGRVVILEINCAPGIAPGLSSERFYVECMEGLMIK